MATPLSNPSVNRAVRQLGRFQLLRLLGKSARTMVWLASDARNGQELMLVLPRAQLAGAQAIASWLAQAGKLSRTSHPGLAAVWELGECDRWPYIAYDRGKAVTLAERLDRHGMPPADLVTRLLPVLQGLAFAHDAGVLHQDVQADMVLWADGEPARLMGLGVAGGAAAPDSTAGGSAQRQAVERDVLGFGLVLFQALAGAPALGLADVNAVIAQMAAQGPEIVRLPRTSPHPIAEALRAIVNRATERQERQRYRNARSLERALAGWLKTNGVPGSGPLALLIDRMRAAGVLPAMPGGAARASRLQSMDRSRTIELADIVLQDVGLSFELLRNINGPRRRTTALGDGSGPILTVRRAITLLGLDGVRRAAQVLRPWPGALTGGHEAELSSLLDRVRHAGLVAQRLRPAGYDAELVRVLAMLQSLGRLVVQYHFPDEAAQIRRLMQAAPPTRVGEPEMHEVHEVREVSESRETLKIRGVPKVPEEPGMTEEAASFAVLGVDIDSLGVAVGRHWGLDEDTLLLARRAPLTTAVHPAHSDAEILRLTASCANEVIDALNTPAGQRAGTLNHVAQRYGKALGLSLKEVMQAALGQAAGKGDAPSDALPDSLTSRPADHGPAGVDGGLIRTPA